MYAGCDQSRRLADSIDVESPHCRERWLDSLGLTAQHIQAL
jgi:hypothetical protein